MNLLPHQIKYAKGYKDKELVIHEGGTGKTVCACVWLKDGRDKEALIICPKRVIKKWEQALKDWDTKGLVISKEHFKKSFDPHYWSAVVVDEADEFASPLFIKGRSALSKSLYEQVKTYPGTPILLLTATPIRSTPWNLHTLLCFYGVYIDWKLWRTQFFNLESRPYIQWKAWFPKPDWREKIRPILEKYADIVLMKDCVDYLPPTTETIVRVAFKPFDSKELTPSARFSEEHQFEQKNKIKDILSIGQEFRKVLVVAYYVEQVENLYKELSKNRETFMVHGSVKDQEQVLKEAQDSDECFLIVQASLGVGFDADSFSCVVFASMSYKVRDFVQMKYRVRRIHNLHPVRYYYILAGEWDEHIYETIQNGRDFVPSEWD